jgi:hypothetical protein
MGSGVDLKLVEGPSHDQAPRAEEKGNHAKDGWEQTPKQALSIPRHRMGDRFAILTTVRIARAEAIVGECMFANFASPRSITVTRVRSRRTKRRAQDKSRAKGLTTDNRRSTTAVSPGRLGTMVARTPLQCMCCISLQVSSGVQMFDIF